MTMVLRVCQPSLVLCCTLPAAWSDATIHDDYTVGLAPARRSDLADSSDEGRRTRRCSRQ